MFFESKEEVIDDTPTNYVYIDTEEKLTEHRMEMMSMAYWCVDTETTGLDPLVDKVILLQIGNRNKQFLIDTGKVSPAPLRLKLEDPDFVLWLQNAKFDYKMIKGTFGWDMARMRDTMLAERILTNGLQKSGFSLAALCDRHLGKTIDKEMQTSFIGHKGDFSEEQLRYAALDVVYVDMVLKKQVDLLGHYKLRDTFVLECDSIPVFSDIEFYGMLLDTEAWKTNIRHERKSSEESRVAFLKDCHDVVEADLFGEPAINPNSSTQVLDLMKKLFPEDVTDRHGKEGTGEEILTNIMRKHKNPGLVQHLLDFRGHEKKASTYGESYTDNVHEKTGRFHPRIEQIGTYTGRPAGRKPNMLNIPKEGEYRSPWIAGPGRKIITIDYATCELRIAASMSEDTAMCKGFRDGVDFHKYTAAQSFKVPLEDVVKEQRSAAKAINFGIMYGQGRDALANKIDIPKDEAGDYLKGYKRTYNGLILFLEALQDRGLKKRKGTIEEFYKIEKYGGRITNTLGYSETVLGRKRFFRVPKVPAEVRYMGSFKKIDDNRWRSARLKKTINYDPADKWHPKMPANIKEYHSKVAQIKREAGNFPIQGGNADLTKIAMTWIRDFIKLYQIKHNGGRYLAHVCLQVYDEILVDCPATHAEEFCKEMHRLMIKAGERVIKRVPVLTDGAIEDHWSKD